MEAPRLDRAFEKKSSKEINCSLVSLLFSELIQYSHNRVDGVHQLEQRLSDAGRIVGIRIFQLLCLKEKTWTRQTRIVQMLYYLQTTVWKELFGTTADSLERSTDHDNEYMIIENVPRLLQFVSVPKELQPLNCGAFMAGALESILIASGFNCSVTSHTVSLDEYKQRTVYLVRFDDKHVERERD